MDENTRDSEAKNSPAAAPKREVGAVHVMPTTFMTKEQKDIDKPKKKKPLFLIIAVLFFMLVVSVALAILLLSRSLRTVGVNETPPATNTEPSAVNAAANINTNTNANINGNANTDVNDSLNVNQDVNVNAPSNQNTNAANLNLGPPPPRGLDADKDDLSDAEEDIYGTGINKPDSDSDGFLDGQEVLAGYSPAGSGKLLLSPVVKTFENTAQEYRMLYPATWPARGTTNEQAEVLFTSETSEFIQVVVESNAARLNIFDWYVLEYPGFESDDLPSRIVDGYPAVVSSDGMTVTVGVADRIYTISYNIGIREVANFTTTFEMMVQSFDSTRGETPAPAENENVNANINAS